MEQELLCLVIRGELGEWLGNKAQFSSNWYLEVPCRYSPVSSLSWCGTDSCRSLVTELTGKCKKQEAWWEGGREGGEVMPHPVQRGLPHSCPCQVWPVSCPRMPMGAHVFRLDKHLCQQTAVTPPVRPFSPALLCNYTPPPAGEGGERDGQTEMQTPSLTSASLQACAVKTESDRESKREGQWGKDSPVWDREVGGEAGDPPPSCERLEVLCASTSGWAGGAERTDVRIGRVTAQRKLLLKLSCICSICMCLLTMQDC